MSEPTAPPPIPARQKPRQEALALTGLPEQGADFLSRDTRDPAKTLSRTRLTPSKNMKATKKSVNQVTSGRLRPVIVCTSHRGVFFGYALDTSSDVIQLQDAKMAIYFGTTRGVMQLAHTGPTPTSKISAPADISVRSITAVMEVTPAAEAAWRAA